MAGKFHLKSVSLPTRSHPTTVRVEEELSKLKSWESSLPAGSASEISVGLSGLQQLHSCVDDLLTMASTREVLLKHQSEKCVEELLDASVRLLDICGAACEMVVKTKEHVQAVESSLRRRRGDEVACYIRFRKMVKNEAKRWMVVLKQMESGILSFTGSDQDHHLCAVIRVLREANAVSFSVFRSVFGFLGTPIWDRKQNRWCLATRLIQRGALSNGSAEKQESSNELESVDVGMSKIQNNGDDVHKRLEELEKCVEELEKGLEVVFRRLIQTRASLLNIFSQ